MGEYFEVSEYTAEDFAQAKLATRGMGEVARRVNPRDAYQWRAYGGELNVWVTDEGMAADGWAPVVESRVTKHTLRDSQEKADRKREKMIRHIEDLNAAMRRKNERIKLQNAKLAAAEARIKELRRENRRLDAEADGAISLDGLRAAWAVAEVPTDEAPIREGDVVIEMIDESAYAVMDAPRCGYIGRAFRILSRAPREPWQDLADAINEAGAQIQENIVRALYERGVRVAGGDDE